MARIADLLSADHVRLDALLERAVAAKAIDDIAYSEFRSGLLRHIGIEERLLFPEIRKRRGELTVVAQLHRDHAALAALLVAPPERSRIAQLRAILEDHNPLEEGPEGMYLHVESLAADDLAALITAVETFPQIPVAPYSQTPLLDETIERLLRER